MGTAIESFGDFLAANRIFAVFVIASTQVCLVAATAALASLLCDNRATLRHAVWSSAVVALLLIVPTHVVGGWRLAIADAFPTDLGSLDRPTATSVVDARAAPVDASPLESGNRHALRIAEQVAAPSVNGEQSGMHDSVVAPALSEDEAVPKEHQPEGDRAALHSSGGVFALRAVHVLGVIYLSVFALMLLRLLLGMRHFATLAHSSERLSSDSECISRQAAEAVGLRSVPFIGKCRGLCMPLTVGGLRASVLVPEDFDTWPEADRRIVLLHELTHVKRRDALWNVAAQVMRVVYWFHPVSLLIDRRLKITRELAADEQVLESGTEPALYAERLVALIAKIGDKATKASDTLAVAMSASTSVEHRIRCILRGRPECSRSRAGLVRCVCIAMLLLIGLTTVRIDRADAQTGSTAGHPTSALEQQLRSESGPTDGALVPEPTEQLYQLPDRVLGHDWVSNVASTDARTPGFAVKVPVDQTVVVNGQVVGSDGQPATGAEVWAAALFVEPPHRERTVTDARGRFQLRLKPLTGKSERWSIRAFGDGEGGKSDQGDLTVQPGEEPPAVTIQMRPRGTLTGRISSRATGEPLAGARLYLKDGRVIQTGSEGEYVAKAISRGNQSATIVATGHRRTRILFDASGSGVTRLDLSLERGTRVAGQVVDVDGNPVSHPLLRIAGSGSALALNGLDAIGNEDGFYVYEGVAVDRVQRSLRASAPGFDSEQAQPFTLRNVGVAAKLDFQLIRNTSPEKKGEPSRLSGDQAQVSAPTRTVSGSVVDATGSPIAGAVVRSGATQYDAIGATDTTDERGEFELQGMPTWLCYVTATAEAFAPAFAAVPSSADPLTITLQRGTEAGGTVTNSTGRAIQGVWIVPVMASPDPRLCNPYWLAEHGTRTDASGHFSFSHLPSSGVAFDFIHPEYTELRGEQLRLGRVDNDVKLESVGAIHGRVAAPDGRPISDFTIYVNIPYEKRPEDRAGGFSVEYSAHGTHFTSENGEFVLTGLAAGNVYRLTARAPTFGQSSHDRVVAIPRDQLRDGEPVEFTLTGLNPLEVSARDASTGKPLIADIGLLERAPRYDANFQWGHDDYRVHLYTTDALGRVELQLPQPEGVVIADAEGYAKTRVAWRDGRSRLDIELHPESVITGSVALPGGEQLAQYRVSASNSAGDSFADAVERDDDGRFRLDQLPAGTYELRFHDSQFQLLARRSETVAAGQQIDITIQLEDVR